MPQLQHNMWVVAARTAVLSVITGGGKWVEIATHADPLYQHLIVTAERSSGGRIRDRDHIRHVIKQACLICGRRPSDPHHLRFVQSRAIGRKVSDEFTVPMCRGHHRELHRHGDEAAWWQKIGIDPFPAARALWLQTRPLNHEKSAEPSWLDQ